MYNPSLRREPRYEPASVIPLKQDNSILEWLKSSGRLMARDDKDETLEEVLGEDDLGGLMGDDGFDEDDDYSGIAEDDDDIADDDDIV